MRLSKPAKLMRQRAVAIALLISTVLVVVALTITVLGADSPHRGRIEPLSTAARGVVGFVEMFFGDKRWG